MALIADILLIAGALAAAFYCMVLSRRLSRFGDLENGMGGAISVLSAQVADMTQTLDRAQTAAKFSSDSLQDATRRAEAAAARLELLLASLHDLPAPGDPQARTPSARNSAPPPVPEAPPETAPEAQPEAAREAQSKPAPEAHSKPAPEPQPGPELEPATQSREPAKGNAAPAFLRRPRLNGRGAG